MDFTLKASKQWQKHRCDCLVIPLIEDKKANQALIDTLEAEHQLKLPSLLKSGDISGKKGHTQLVHSNTSTKRLLFIGLGKSPVLADLISSIKKVHSSVNHLNIKQLAIWIPELEQPLQLQLVQQTAITLLSASYQYDKTLSKKKPKAALKQISVLAPASSAAFKKALVQGEAIGHGILNTKELGNLPANICTPSYLATQAQALAKNNKALTTKILSEAALKKLKMNAMLSVTAGTDEPAKFIIMDYKGGKAADKPYVLVGKGVTFDSGGISLKPGAAMDEMKYDMCGAASVFGTMEAITRLQLPINVVGLVAAVENMPSGHATKPGDVITSMSGQTIEVLNTDAEGRLVLCDALTYAKRFKPKAVIDIATLTGAAIVALGKHATALYSNDDSLAEKLLAAGNKTHDRAWQMPLWDDYNQQLKSNFADMANIGGPQGGSVTAACFLSRFTQDYTWAHLDIAGPAWVNGAQKGATGRPVSLLTQFLIEQT